MTRAWRCAALVVAASAALVAGASASASLRFGVAFAADDDARLVHDYLLSCAGCHTLDGSGSARVPSLRGIDRLLAKPGGRAYVLRVPGVANAPLSDARLAALLDWIFASFGNHATPRFSADEVHVARATSFVDPKAARAQLE